MSTATRFIGGACCTTTSFAEVVSIERGFHVGSLHFRRASRRGLSLGAWGARVVVLSPSVLYCRGRLCPIASLDLHSVRAYTF